LQSSDCVDDRHDGESPVISSIESETYTSFSYGIEV